MRIRKCLHDCTKFEQPFNSWQDCAIKIKTHRWSSYNCLELKATIALNITWFNPLIIQSEDALVSESEPFSGWMMKKQKQATHCALLRYQEQELQHRTWSNPSWHLKSVSDRVHEGIWPEHAEEHHRKWDFGCASTSTQMHRFPCSLHSGTIHANAITCQI